MSTVAEQGAQRRLDRLYCAIDCIPQQHGAAARDENFNGI